jgi:transcriptional regulator with XRE-family HTH domain
MSQDSKSEERELSEKVAERLKRLRNKSGASQMQVARALGYTSHSVVLGWENGENGNLPSALNLEKLARFFDVSVDYLLGLSDIESRQTPSAARATRQRKLKQELFRAALNGKKWDDLAVREQLDPLRRRLGESDEACYERVLTDVLYPPPPEDLPQLSQFQLDESQTIAEEIERLFRDRPQDKGRNVSLYVLDLKQVASDRLQCLILGMRGAELIKERYQEEPANFTLAVADGWMVQNVLMAPNLVRGDLADVTIMPLTLGRSRFEPTAATTMINHFRFIHRDYGIPPVDVVGMNNLENLRMGLHSVRLAFMGLGIIRPERKKSLFSTLLDENKFNPDELERQGVIGDVLFHLICKNADSTWSEYSAQGGRRLAVDINDPAGDDKIHAIDLRLLEEIVKIGRGQVVALVKDTTRVPILRAALEMRWANAVICTLEVARELKKQLA